MTEVFELFQNIKTWRAGDVRAPHKPLLILLAIAELKKGNRMLPYEAIEDKLTQNRNTSTGILRRCLKAIDKTGKLEAGNNKFISWSSQPN